MNERVKYTVSLPLATAKKLDELAVSEVMSKPEILRNAIGLYSYVKSNIGPKDRLCIVKNSGSVLKEVVMI